jgi:hypothetical protein
LEWIPCVDSWAAWEIRDVMLKADGPAVRNLWIIDCSEACVTAAVRTRNTLFPKFTWNQRTIGIRNSLELKENQGKTQVFPTGTFKVRE